MRERRDGLRRGGGAFWRTAVAAGVAGCVLVAEIAIASWPAAADGSGSGSAAASSWVPGEAKAIAQAFSLAPTTAGLGYNVVLGTSVADYQVQEGQAESQTFNGGAIVLAATSKQCDGSNPPVTQSQLPQPAIAETSTGNTTATNTISRQYANGDIPGAALGSEYASVTTQPTATAVTKSADIDIPGVLDISGIQSSAFVEQVPGQLRKAVATADVAELQIGPVDLKGLHFEATQETGPGGAIVQQATSFSVAAAVVGGQAQAVGADQLSQLFTIVNTALAGTGFHVNLPTQTTLDSGQVDLTPLSIGIDNSALGQEIVGQNLLGPTQTVRDAIDQVLLQDISCKMGTPLTVADIALGVGSGGGNLDLQLGELSAVSDGATYGNPFGFCFVDCSNSGALDFGSTGQAPTADLSGSVPTGAATVGTGAAMPAASGTLAPASQVPAQAAGPLRRTVHCVTTSLAGHPGCSKGAALPVALAGLAVVLGFATADAIRLRRYRSIVPLEVPSA